MVHVSLSVLSRAGKPPIITTEVEPGVHGATVAGTHGVGTPLAAAVRVLHVPKGAMFVTGT